MANFDEIDEYGDEAGTGAVQNMTDQKERQNNLKKAFQSKDSDEEMSPVSQNMSIISY